MAPVVSTGVSAQFLTRHPCTGTMLIFSGSFNGKTFKLCVSPLYRGHANLLRKGIVRVFLAQGTFKKKSLCPSISIVGKKLSHTSSLHWEACHSALYCSTEKNLELCVSSLCQGHPYQKKKLESCVSSLRDDLPKDLPTKCMRSPSLCPCFGKTHRLPAHHLTHHWSIAPASPVPPHPLLAPPQSGRVVSILRQ